MNIQRWIARREPNWERLEFVLEKLGQKGLKSLNYREIKELSSLYRGFQESGVLMNYIPYCPLLSLGSPHAPCLLPSQCQALLSPFKPSWHTVNGSKI